MMQGHVQVGSGEGLATQDFCWREVRVTEVSSPKVNLPVYNCRCATISCYVTIQIDMATSLNSTV